MFWAVKVTPKLSPVPSEPALKANTLDATICALVGETPSNEVEIAANWSIKPLAKSVPPLVNKSWTPSATPPKNKFSKEVCILAGNFCQSKLPSGWYSFQ